MNWLRDESEVGPCLPPLSGWPAQIPRRARAATAAPRPPAAPARIPCRQTPSPHGITSPCRRASSARPPSSPIGPSLAPLAHLTHRYRAWAARPCYMDDSSLRTEEGHRGACDDTLFGRGGFVVARPAKRDGAAGRSTVGARARQDWRGASVAQRPKAGARVADGASLHSRRRRKVTT